MRPLSWRGIARLGLIQAALGAIVVLTTSTLNRVMIVELHLPAIVPGALVALHYVVQVLRPRLGYGADVGGRRTPWIVGGMALLAAGSTLAAAAVGLMASGRMMGLGLAALAFLAVGVGVGSAGTSLLTLVAQRAAPERRGAAASVLWLMMIAGIAVTAGTAGHLLDPFTPGRLVAVVGVASALAFGIATCAVLGMEGPSVAIVAAAGPGFVRALRDVWQERQARGFAIFVFVSMLAYSAQELMIEPFAGAVFQLSPGQSASLTGLHHGGVLAGMLVVALGTTLWGGFGGPAMRVWTVGGCAGSALAALGLGFAGLAGPGAPLSAAILLLGFANGIFAVAAIGAMMGLASHGRAAREGTRVGLWGAAQALAFGAGGLVGTGAIDVARASFAAPALAYAAVFTAEAALFLAAAATALLVFRTARPMRRSIPAHLGGQNA